MPSKKDTELGYSALGRSTPQHLESVFLAKLKKDTDFEILYVAYYSL